MDTFETMKASIENHPIQDKSGPREQSRAAFFVWLMVFL